MDVMFRRLAENRFLGTEWVSGVWDTSEQHLAPALGLLAHMVEKDRDERRGDDSLKLARVAFEVFGTFPVGEVETEVRVLRPGRSVELVEATLAAEGRVAVTLRAWLMQQGDTAEIEGTALPEILTREDMPPAALDERWPGKFVRSFEMLKQPMGVGRAQTWMRPLYPLLDSEPVSALARVIAQMDLANGLTPRADPRELAFPNLDLAGSFFREPQGEWLGFDTSVSYGPNGVGQTQSTLHDELGPMGTVSQTLALRYR